MLVALGKCALLLHNPNVTRRSLSGEDLWNPSVNWMITDEHSSDMDALDLLASKYQSIDDLMVTDSTQTHTLADCDAEKSIRYQ